MPYVVPLPVAAQPLICQRPGCGHRYVGEHAPGGGGCIVWDQDTGQHCDCIGFRWVPLEGAAPMSYRPQQRP